jgi:hypothetical protein
MDTPSDHPSPQTAEIQADSASGAPVVEDPGFATDDDFDVEERPTLLNVAPGADATPARAAETPEAYDVLADLIEKAIALGNVSAMACNVAARLAKLATRSMEQDKVSRQTVDAASRCAMKLATATRDACWVNVVVRLYHTRGEAPPVTIVDQLYATLPNARNVDWTLLRRYVERLRARRSQMTPTERFAAKRMEGLLQLGPA